MIQRSLQLKLKELAKKFPVIAILGPRQSGKTTLAKDTFDKHKYLSLEDINTFNFAQNDPYTFFDTHHNENGIIIGKQLSTKVESFIVNH